MTFCTERQELSGSPIFDSRPRILSGVDSGTIDNLPIGLE
jgi:hypothetical protein